ncbi:MAG TPA: metal ABC transporter permease [Acetobacteraceae bacterium]|nr:metal ABC transporter permease [Acetobacteraceae bacterium]
MRALLFDPFLSYGFMRTALVACVGLALANAPVSALLLQRRMTLTASVLAHAVMPGAALGFLIAGYSLVALCLGGFAAGLLVLALAAAIGGGDEGARLSVFYLLALAGGVLLVSLRGSNIDLMHVLFGTVLAVDMRGLVLIAFIATVTMFTLAAIWRPLAVEGFDPAFLRAVGGGGPVFRYLFLGLVVLCLVAGFQAFGTLLSIGPMLLPAIAARRCAQDLRGQIGLALLFGSIGAIAGLLLSYHLNVPSGPAIVLADGAIYGAALLAARRASVAAEPALQPAE